MATRESRVARAWRIAFAHMSGGEIPMEALDFAHVDERIVSDKSLKEQDAEIDRSADESFPASDPPSWSRSHA